MPTEENESNFKEFSNRLLAAEESVHRSGEVALYSPEALQSILREFCEIIASDFEAQSCTIQLKLLDVRSCNFIDRLTKGELPPGVRSDVKDYQDRIVAGFRAIWTSAKGTYRSGVLGKDAKDHGSRRDSILRDPSAFPYCIYPKGAMWLAAANQRSPWQPFTDWLITDLYKGLTAEIVQEKSPRERDPFTIRKSRAFRKLGDADPWLWTNRRPDLPGKTSPLYFFNYYGVPIRVHSGGDVIGILKIENKGFAYASPDGNANHLDPNHQLHDALNEFLESPRLVSEDEELEGISERFNTAIKSAETALTKCGFEARRRSLLSLVYLAFDLSKCHPTGSDTTIGQFLTTSYAAAPDSTLDGIPPAQVFFDSVSEEDAFFGVMHPEGATTTERRPELSVVSKFFLSINECLEQRDADSPVRDRLDKAILDFANQHHPGTAVNVRVAKAAAESTMEFPDFFYEVIGTRGPEDDKTTVFHFHVQVCPTVAESGNSKLLQECWGLDGTRADAYRAHFDNQHKAVALSGEYIRKTLAGYPDVDRITHLPTDRLAARVQALTYAFPVPAFPPTDSWKLSWAALEIGKLIERQISYRGTHGDPTVPLTADDFFRIPISDLHFVDTARQQYLNAQALQSSLRYHMANLSLDLGFTWGIKASERVKGFRSYFDRIGQSHRAENDALVAIWSYILFQKLLPEDMQKIRSHKPPTKVAALLEELSIRLEALWEEDPGPEGTLVRRWKEALPKWLGTGVFPDLRFAAPALDGLRAGRSEEALQRLRENLTHCPTGLSNHDVTKAFDSGELEKLLYRRYDSFVTLAVSLYLQLLNVAKAPAYLDFYRDSRATLDDLRNRLVTLEEQVTRTPQGSSLIGGLSKTLGKLRVEILSLSTDAMAAIFRASSPSSEEVLRFSIQGIYKRIRMLANVSGNQLSPNMLNWENGRFDYLGGRVTCLFKNQVFAVYEEMWRRGDPFSPPGNADEPSTTSKGGSFSRQRWLCLRTKVHAGDDGYNAWQISALMDPFAFSDNYWEKNAYTLNSLREVLTKAYRYWHNDGKNYKRLATARGALQKHYRDWFFYATKVLERQPSSPVIPAWRPFGLYLGEKPLDLLVHILKRDSKEKNEAEWVIRWDDLKEILNVLDTFATTACTYSTKQVLPIVRGEKDISYAVPKGDALLSAAEKLYRSVCGLVGRARLHPEVSEFAAGLCDELDMFVRHSHEAQWPLVFVNKIAAERAKNLKRWIDASSVSRREDRDQKIDSLGRSASELRMNDERIARLELEATVRQIQGSQMDYLFDLKDGAKSLSLRGQTEAMDRIICYILLHSSKAYGDRSPLTKEVRDEPNAYNLFYHVMSLMPVEIQARTALADTMAEQYHKIYKIGSRAVSATMLQQERLKGIGQEQDVTDREVEVQFEDYINQQARMAAERRKRASE